jgi:hypothetical protein
LLIHADEGDLEALNPALYKAKKGKRRTAREREDPEVGAGGDGPVVADDDKPGFWDVDWSVLIR